HQVGIGNHHPCHERRQQAHDGAGVAVGSIVPAFRYFLMVLRDRPVRRAFSRIGSFSRKVINSAWVPLKRIRKCDVLVLDL
ncbi:hypothetical protein, partial [Microvirga lotononidis]|uniref:hypothetical protein n=1 Tax=Microvirga lotononidis TaxID=864069 RepID=UPI001AEC3651